MTKTEMQQAVNEFAEEAKRIYGAKLKEIILYGSCARGDFTTESDIDLMILLDVPGEEINFERRRIYDISDRLDRYLFFKIMKFTGSIWKYLCFFRMCRERVCGLPERDKLHRDYAKYRISRAKEDLDTAHMLYEAGKYRIANNRAYYAIFLQVNIVELLLNFEGDILKQAYFR